MMILKSKRDDCTNLRYFFIIFICGMALFAFSEAYPQGGTLSFTDISQAAGISFAGDPDEIAGHAAIWADVTGDGRPDLYITRLFDVPMRDRFFRNNGNNIFIDEGDTRGIGDFDGGSHGSTFADLDNDGDFDLFNGTTYLSEPYTSINNIFRNDGMGFFTDVSSQTGIPVRNWETRGVVAFDMDKDGDLDLLAITNYQGTDDPIDERNEIYRNEGNLTFTAINTGDLFTAPAGQGATDCDYDSDGDIDIIAGNRTGPVNILNNDGFGNFTLVEPTSIGIIHQGREGATAGDVNNDGFLDLLLSDWDFVNKVSIGQLYLNDGDGTFTYSTTFPHAEGYMGGFADLDNDSDLDIVFAGDDVAYLNDGNGNFTTGPSVPVSGINDPRAIGFADIDDDGDLDFAIGAKRSRNYLIRNNFNGGNWLKTRLISPQGQAGAFGAKLRIFPAGELGGSLLSYREARSNNGYLGQNDPILHFGLGNHTQVDVQVEFLNGVKIEQTNVDANQTIILNASGQALPMPVISSFSPQSGAADASVRIFGQNFAGAADVTFNDVSASNFAVVSDGEINALVPAGATTGPIRVVNVNGTGTSANDFIVIPDTISGNFVLDNFNRSTGLGSNWVANTSYAIVNNRLSNIATDGNWDDQAVFAARKNPKAISYTIADDADAAGIDQMGFVVVFGFPSTTSSGYAVTRRTAVNEIRLWTLTNGLLTAVLDKNQSPNLSGPVAGDVVKVIASNANGTNRFDLYVNGQLDGTVTDDGQSFNLDENYWGGVTMRSALNNDIDDFTMSLGVEAPSILAKVSGDAQADTVRQQLPNPVVIKVTDDNGSPIEGISVNFEVIEGGGAISAVESPGNLTNSNGEASVNWILGPRPGNNSLRVAAAGLPGQIFTAIGTADSVATITKIAGDNQTGTPGQQLPNAFVVELVDKWGNLAVSAPVNFTLLPTANGSLSVTSTTAGSDGRASSRLTMSTNTPLDQVRVTAPGYTGAEILFQATPGLGNPCCIAIHDGNNQTASAAFELPAPLRVIAKDDNGIPTENVSITFSVVSGGGSFGGNSSIMVKTNSSGIASAVPRLGSGSGITNIFQASAPGLQGSPLTFTAISAPPYRLVAISELVQSGQMNLPLSDSIAVKVVDQFETPVANQQVALAITAGGGTVNGASVVNLSTGSDGQVKAEWQLGPDPGEHKLTAISTYQGANLDGSPLEFVADVTQRPAAALSIVSGNNQSGVVGQSLAEPFVVRVTDGSDGPVADWPVIFEVISGGGSLSIESTLTNSAGIAESRLKLGTSVGNNNNGVRVTSPQTTEVTFVASASENQAAKIELLAGSGQAPSPAGLPLPGKIEVGVTNDFGNPVANISVTFRIRSGGGSINSMNAGDNEATATTDVQGIAGVTWYLGGALGDDNQSLEIITQNGSEDLAGSPILVLATATTGPADAAVSSITGNPTLVPANGGSKSAITVKIMDKFGNPVKDLSVGISSDRSDFIDQPQGATDENGETVGYVASNAAGSSAITASVIGGVTLDASVNIIFEAPSVVDLTNFSAGFAGFDGARIAWQTLREIDNLGFNVLRSTSQTGSFIKVNDALISTREDGRYEFFDREIEVGRSYYYLLEDVDISGRNTQHGPVMVAITAPESFVLGQNYPNPFNPETKIRYQLPAPGFVTLRVYDSLGREVRTLVSGEMPAGFHVATWDAFDGSGNRVSSGIYFYQLVAGQNQQIKRMIFMK